MDGVSEGPLWDSGSVDMDVPSFHESFLVPTE